MNSKVYLSVLAALLLVLPLVVSANQDYRLGAGDEISITVYEEDDLSMTLKIDESGTFDYPYLGQIVAKGKSTNALKSEITNGLLQDILINPSVNVSIVTYRDFYIDGEVQRPGSYPYQAGLTIKQAITLAGGATEWASSTKFEILREGRDEPQPADRNTPVRPGDTVTVLEGFF
jgi:protein involved in polysaccharide export with SLBB domain